MTSARGLRLLTVAAVLVLALAAFGAWGLWTREHERVVWAMLALGPVYAAAVWLVGRSATAPGDGAPCRRLPLILGVALLARLLLIAAPPLSTDIYRYVWDGRVQVAGINPYVYRPADPQVAFLRDQAVYPRINRAATAVTIYPPTAQLIFHAVAAVGGGVTLMKVVMVLFEALAVGATIALLRSRGLCESRILAYVWHPLPMFEFAGSGHVDAAALGLMLCACLAAERRRPGFAGGLLGAATLVKYFPLVLLPALYRRWDWRLPLAVAVAVLALYLPYIGVGRQVLGFLPGYVQQEGLASGEGFFLLEALRAAAPFPDWANAAYLSAAAALLGWMALKVAWRPAQEVSLTSAMWLLGTFTLILSPHLPWYFVWVLPLLCFRTVWAFIYISVMAPLLYALVWDPDPLVLHATLYLPFAVILIAEFLFRSPQSATEILDDGSTARRRAD